MIKVIFFGTEKFASGILEALLNNTNFNVVCVITQPDRPSGRKQKTHQSLVKLMTQKYHLPVYQPMTLHDFILPVHADLNIVCEYGLIIPENLLNSARYGSLNVHPSLLPHYRGASPIQSALINGETETGVSIMLMDEKMDHGPILRQDTLQIDSSDTYTTLAAKLLQKAISGLLEAVPAYIEGKITPQMQNESHVTFCKIFTKESGHVDWSKTAQEIYNLGRGLEIWPGIWTTFQNKRIKLIKVKPTTSEDIPTGKIMLKNNQVFVGCNNSSLEIITLQPEGKNTMPATSWINGIRDLASAKMV